MAESRRYKLAVATMFRDEAPHLHEWVEYHRMVGVEHFWLYDDGSSDAWRDVLAPHLDSGLVDVFDWPAPSPRAYMSFQVESQRDAVRLATGRARWLALIDIDEFLLPFAQDTVTACLDRDFADAAAVYVNWRNFGTGGIHLERAGPMLCRLTACADALHPRNAIGKSIVRPDCVRPEAMWHPHHAPLASGAVYFNGDGDAVPTEDLEPRLDGQVHQRLLRINHYPLRDEVFFRSVRLPRVHRLGDEEWLAWEHHAAFSDAEDRAIETFIRERHPQRFRTLWGLPEERWPTLGPYVSAGITGGIGNNLFQVAAASALAWDHGAEPVFPDLDPASPRYLGMFQRCNVAPDPAEWREWFEPSYAHTPIAFEPNLRLIGYFQSERYFAHHEARIRELFMPSPADARHIGSRYGSLLERADTVGVQVRFWGDDDPGGAMYPQYGACYLERALADVPSDARLVLSSNNLEFARACVPPRMRHITVLDGEPDHIDLLVLSGCRRLVISNSSFGWWAAWLGERAGCDVVHPRRWVNGLPDGDVCPPRWLTVDAPEE